MERESTYLAVQAKKCPVFDGIGVESLSALFACLGARRRRLAKGDALMRSGERADRIGILLTGSLSVSAYDFEGRRTIIKRVGPGEIVAAAQSLSGADAMSVDVEADDGSDVLVVKTDRILLPCENACPFHARLVRNIMRTLAVTTLELNRKIKILSHRSTQDRLMAYLRSVALQKGTAEFDIPFDRQQLADFLCVERSALSAEISRLSSLGLITSRKNHFTLHRAVCRPASPSVCGTSP
ncbi:MAG: Crp/Fnr family transcriptional regulator [Kiritimatiellae bacterium]|nr:Crp/Fnr family transcriptional regulator [Kiritimatiellia bacterium]